MNNYEIGSDVLDYLEISKRTLQRLIQSVNQFLDEKYSGTKTVLYSYRDQSYLLVNVTQERNKSISGKVKEKE